VAIEDSGAQLCGDLGFPIACADEGCEELDYAIVCNPDDPPEMFLVIGDCLPVLPVATGSCWQRGGGRTGDGVRRRRGARVALGVRDL